MALESRENSMCAENGVAQGIDLTIYQVIQVVTKLHPQTLEVTIQPFERVTFSPSQKGHKELPGNRFSNLEIIFNSKLKFEILVFSSHFSHFSRYEAFIPKKPDPTRSLRI